MKHLMASSPKLSLKQMFIVSVFAAVIHCSFAFVAVVPKHFHDISLLATSTKTGLGSDQIGSAPPSFDPRIVARKVMPSVALVTPIGVRNSTSRGSGFVVDFPSSSNNSDEHNNTYTYLLTAAHVASPGHRLQISFPSKPNVTYTGKILGRSLQTDLALLRIDESKADSSSFPPPLALGKEVAEVGTPVFCLGYPSGGVVGAAMTSGIVCASARGIRTTTATNDDNAGNQTLFVVTNAAMAGGMSGGPLVDKSGTVLGVNALINFELRALGNYAVDVKECQTFLKNLEIYAESNSNSVDNNGDSSSLLYRVYLYNDRFNKREHVAKILKDVAKLQDEGAEKIMMEAHTTGRSVICEFPGEGKAEARSLCEALRQEDILVEVEQVQQSAVE